MEIEEGQVIYEKTADPNIVKRYRLLVDEIHINKLVAKIADLDARLAELPEGGASTDGVTDPLALKAINDANELLAIRRSEAVEEKAEKVAIKAEIDKLK